MFGAFMALLSMTSCNNGNSNENVTSISSFESINLTQKCPQL